MNTRRSEQIEHRNTPVETVFEWLELFVISFAFVLMFITFIVRHSPVIGPSMNPTLTQGDILLVSHLGYQPENGDVIVFQSPGNGLSEPLVKRIIATGGQTVDIDFNTWTVTVDGEVLDEPYINREDKRMLQSTTSFPLDVPEGYIFVMGDNRNHSKDSRDMTIGLVDERYIIGHVIFRLYPFDSFGTLS